MGKEEAIEIGINIIDKPIHIVGGKVHQTISTSKTIEQILETHKPNELYVYPSSEEEIVWEHTSINKVIRFFTVKQNK